MLLYVYKKIIQKFSHLWNLIHRIFIFLIKNVANEVILCIPALNLRNLWFSTSNLLGSIFCQFLFPIWFLIWGFYCKCLSMYISFSTFHLYGIQSLVYWPILYLQMPPISYWIQKYTEIFCSLLHQMLYFCDIPP